MVRFCHHEVCCIHAATWSACTPWLTTDNVWVKSPLNTTGMSPNKLWFCWISQKIVLIAIKLNLCCIDALSQMISDTVWSKTASENWMNIWHVFINVQFNGMLNWKWAVEPSDRNKNAMSDKAMHKTILLCEWYWWHSAVHKKVFSVLAEPCTKKWACSGLISTAWTMISKADCCSVLNCKNYSVNIAACSS